MSPTPGGLESDPSTYQLNSVYGDVSGSGAPIVGATVTVLQTKESFTTGPGGSFLIVLDPKTLGTNDHKLEFSAEGFQSQIHEVFIPDDNQSQISVVLQPGG